MGGASRWWLHHSLQALNKQLDGRLQVHTGDPASILPELARQNGVHRIYWNRCYEPWCIQRDAKVKKELQAGNIEVRSYNGSLLWEPWDVQKKDGTPYKVFTPYYTKGCHNAGPPRKPLLRPDRLDLAEPSADACSIDDLKLLPKVRWDRNLEPHWKIGEAAAHTGLHQFLERGIINYRQKRDFPALRNVSRLSPHLH